MIIFLTRLRRMKNVLTEYPNRTYRVRQMETCQLRSHIYKNVFFFILQLHRLQSLLDQVGVGLDFGGDGHVNEFVTDAATEQRTIVRI